MSASLKDLQVCRIINWSCLYRIHGFFRWQWLWAFEELIPTSRSRISALTVDLTRKTLKVGPVILMRVGEYDGLWLGQVFMKTMVVDRNWELFLRMTFRSSRLRDSVVLLKFFDGIFFVLGRRTSQFFIYWKPRKTGGVMAIWSFLALVLAKLLWLGCYSCVLDKTLFMEQTDTKAADSYFISAIKF